jgi:hypothetical protein
MPDKHPHDESQIIMAGSDIQGMMRSAKPVTVQSNRQHPIAEAQWHWLNWLYPPARPRDLLLQAGATIFASALAGSLLAVSMPLWLGRDLIPFLAAGAIGLIAFAIVLVFVAEQIPHGYYLMGYRYICLFLGVLLVVVM